MAGFLIDANLPYRFSLWSGDEYVHVKDLDDTWTDSQIWRYAEQHGLTIMSKGELLDFLAFLRQRQQLAPKSVTASFRYAKENGYGTGTDFN